VISAAQYGRSKYPAHITLPEPSVLVQLGIPRLISMRSVDIRTISLPTASLPRFPRVSKSTSNALLRTLRQVVGICIILPLRQHRIDIVASVCLRVMLYHRHHR
jgi:hypothetical protein